MRHPLKCCALIAVVFAGAVHAGQPPASSALETFGKGVQIYVCKASGSAYAWAFKAPEATLSDARGKAIGKHFAGPTWQASDGSTVVGEVLQSSSSPDARGVAWLVLRAKSHTGAGVMDSVQYIVRTRTEGGLAPASGCDAGHAGSEVRVPYNAVYTFFRG